MVAFDILVFLLVLGVLVFIHELGHFVAAKACGIYCDRFSLGMPPRVWGFKWGETDYCIGALPIGGYVKMAGQEDAPRSAEERDKEYGHVPPERFYSNKPVWQRAIVIAAGPFMNLVLGVFLYGTVAAMGATVPEAKVDSRIGSVEKNSPAASAPMYLIREGQTPQDAIDDSVEATGWRTGDKILSIDGQEVASIMQDVRIDAVLGTGRVLRVVLERTEADGSVQRYVSPVEPKPFGDDEHARFGVYPFRTALVGRVLPDSPAEAAGINVGDIVVRAQGVPVDAVTFSEMVEQVQDGETMELDIDRPIEGPAHAEGDAPKYERIKVSVTPRKTGRFAGILFDPPMHADTPAPEHAQVTVADLSPEVAKASGGLKRKDILLQVDGRPATVALLEELEKTSTKDTLPILVERPSVMLGLLRRGETLELELPLKRVGAIGVVWEPKMVFYQVPPEEVAPAALRQGYLALSRTVQTVKMLLTPSDSVGPKDLGGPVMIYQIMSDARRLGLNWLLEMAAFISINLCVFNLLPLPVLDGGQLVFLGIEAVRRKPVDVRVLERVQQMGLVLIILLILFVTFNDLQRLFTSWIP